MAASIHTGFCRCVATCSVWGRRQCVTTAEICSNRDGGVGGATALVDNFGNRGVDMQKRTRSLDSVTLSNLTEHRQRNDQLQQKSVPTSRRLLVRC